MTHHLMRARPADQPIHWHIRWRLYFMTPHQPPLNTPLSTMPASFRSPLFSSQWVISALFSLWGFSAAPVAAAPLADSIVIGQSLPMQGTGFFSADRVRQGSMAYVSYINANGGIGGRKVELVTLDDNGDPEKYERNFKQLVNSYHAVAIINCIGDIACERASALSEELRVPLIGPISGAKKLRMAGRQFTIPLRASYEVQAEALAKQLKSVAISRVALFSSFGKTSELPTTLQAKLVAIGISTEFFAIDESDPRTLDAAAERLKRGDIQAVVLDLSESALRSFGELEASKKFSWPATLATISPSTLTQLSKEIRSRVIGFVSTVPNPEDMRLPINRDLNAQAEQYSGADAVTFEGAEAYINTRVVMELLKRSGKEPTAASVRSAAEAMGPMDIGGFHLRLNVGRGGPSWVDVGMRSRNGLFLQ
jgi:branched-chain amino acid transport system substrate-binding protein